LRGNQGVKAIDFGGDLNEEQLAAATAPDGPLLILAAAGTGKTRTLVYRVAYLVDQGVPADRILLLTFTNRASREMLERSAQLIGSSTGVSWSGTFHHIANRMLRRYAGLLGYRSDYTILDRDDSRTVIGRCVKELKLQSKEFPKKPVLLSLVGTAANTQTSFEDVVADRFESFEVDPDAILAVLHLYEKKKRELDAMDFDDLLVNCLRLFQENQAVCARYQDHFEHVLVDEYQDTNTIQAQMVDLLANRTRNLFVVGDDFQSIYSWRGADFRNILSFPKRYPDAGVHKLETNYRSVPEILEVANACIAGNPEQFQKILRATRESHRRPRVARLRDGSHQGRYVVELIGELCREGYKRSEITILYRAHYHAMELQMELTRSRVPHVITSGVRFFEQAHVKDVLSLLRILESPEDELAFVRLLCLLPGVGEKTALKAWAALGGRFDACKPEQRASLMESLRPQARKRWGGVDPILSAYFDESLDSDGGEAIHRFLKQFYETYAVDTFENHDSRVDDIRELILHTGSFETVEQFLSDIALLTNLDAEAENLSVSEKNSVRLSTVHQAKGLEWPVVIVLWATEGMFPSGRSLQESAAGEAEERRLFYVAVTRAKDDLILCVPELRRMRDGGVMYCEPSRFVEEIPPGLVRDRRIGFI